MKNNMKVLIALTICATSLFGKDVDLAKVNLNYDQKIIALTILAEARGEGNMGMYAVACVIQQRSIERKMTVMEVCLAPSQFSCWNGKGNIASKMDDKKNLFAAPQAEYAAQLARVIWGNQALERKVIGNANHYHTTDVKPKWSKGKDATVTIKHHKFYKL
jgi:spore germination cell wall hydrolase CwlJ-like protein